MTTAIDALRALLEEWSNPHYYSEFGPRDCAADLRALLDSDAFRAMGRDEWLTMESAPKDGTRILIRGDGTFVAGWGYVPEADTSGWCVVNDCYMAEHMATHWRPLPTPPTSEAAP